MLKKIFSKLILSALILCVLLCSCTAEKPENITPGETKLSESAGSSVHTSSGKSEKIASSDYLQMLIDKETLSVSINDKNNNFTWNSLPEKVNDAACAFAVTLITENGIYEMNTQDNSVAFGTATYSKNDNGVTVTYVLSDKKETASENYEEITSNDIYVSFSVSYTLHEQSMTVDIDTEQIRYTPDGIISSISFLPYMGASYEDSANDYFLVPDGSGAVMHLNAKNAETDNINISIYGEDPFVANDEKTASATVPVFGVKRNNNAFTAIVTDGDALASVSAERGSPSKINASFALTPVRYDEESNKLGYGSTYNGHITVVYKYLADGSADYIGIAAAAREEFIKNGTLPSESSENTSRDIPFCVSVVGSQDGAELTTIQQTIDILGILKGKGIDNIQLICKGFLSGGYAQKNLYYADTLSSLGGYESYEELYSYTKKLNYTLFTDVNIFSSSKNYSSLNSVSSLSGEKASYTLFNDLGYRDYLQSRLSTRIGTDTANSGFSKRNPSVYSSVNGYTMYLSDMSKLSEHFSAFISGRIAENCDGFSVSDAGHIIYSDNTHSRQENMDTVSSLLRAAGSDASLSVKGGNIYTLYAADYVSDMSFDTFYPESDMYVSVPFVQAVIHGSTLYSGEPIDAGDPLYRYDMLRYIEYGAVPAFEWVYDTSSIFCYDGYLLSERITEITEFYEKANNALASVSSATITGHREITQDTDGKAVSGVFCTSYSNGVEIYVNYTGTAVVTPGNIVVGAYDFVKITR